MISLQCTHNGDRFIFRYEKGTEQAMLDALCELVLSRETVFDWTDAAIISHQIGRQLADEVKQQLAGKGGATNG